MTNKQAEAIKAEGNGFFKSGHYSQAIVKYLEATAIDPNVPSYWSNMAACYEKLNQFDEMADAGRSCIKADKKFVKGYFRLAVAYKALNDLGNCIKTLENGLAIQSSNRDLKLMKQQVTELQRGEQVAVYCGNAEEMMQKGDIAGAMKQLDFASRLDAGNPDITRMMSKVKPKYDVMERKRKSGLSPVEKFKEQGDASYKNANFEVAIEHYTKCLNQLQNDGKSGSDLALKAFANRAACYKQISDFDGVISDCSAVLEVDPENAKALIRRAQAFEGVERYRFALQDVKTVLMMGIPKVGKTNYDLCNMMQHRLHRTVTQLKKMNSS
mmetsp:Transcript_24053/g.26955  ORF Transcript_24053/g.26955 Transcript_24053/m.26955 type:complete len:326 (+) Transcript_24053:201-1178(+)|eukprot:CAMPEP_0170797780 /NCGR_PEP_ID=MMETSP0733-20121128/25850_1 /TAXON_ID=186038 /ORGANISM="Fragilariopsis kerguelensis, Strain L26-C5" /LENGTH=325 /DNA_ID=CAMNT_0011148779 /DNA_START=191 /DNA_END=1168 /DNA_ORIENTATION=-